METSKQANLWARCSSTQGKGQVVVWQGGGGGEGVTRKNGGSREEEEEGES